MKALAYYFLVLVLFIACKDFPFKKTTRKIEISPQIVGSWNLLVLKGEDPDGHFHYWLEHLMNWVPLIVIHLATTDTDPG
ncbi:hypothetical protein ES705_15820 [subsurface metagenome]